MNNDLKNIPTVPEKTLSGTFTVTDVPNGYTYQDVTFSEQFMITPTVTLQAIALGNPTTALAFVDSVTVLGFRCKIQNGWIYNQDIRINWTASQK